MLKLKAQVAKARRYADHPQEPLFEEDEEDDAVKGEEQPDWVDVYEGQNQIYEGVETQKTGLKKVLKQMMNRRQKVQTLIYPRCAHYL